MLTCPGVVLANIARDLAGLVRASNEHAISMIVSGHFLTALVEELATGLHECSPVIPLQKLVVIRHPDSFILAGPGRLPTDSPDQEAIESLPQDDLSALWLVGLAVKPKPPSTVDALF